MYTLRSKKILFGIMETAQIPQTKIHFEFIQNFMLSIAAFQLGARSHY